MSMITLMSLASIVVTFVEVINKKPQTNRVRPQIVFNSSIISSKSIPYKCMALV